MELNDSILKGFADAVNSGSQMTPSDSQHIYATVTRVVEDELVYVQLNGAEIDTPAKSLVEVGVGDLVMATMRGHTLTIIGNVSYPALTRVGPVYMTLTAEGLLIGKLDEENQPIDGYIIVGTNGSSIYNIDGQLLAIFGPTTQIGMNSKSHVMATDSGVEIRNGSDKILADFTANGITLRDSTGTTIASFAANSISIGQSTSATVSFCGGKAVIALDGSTLKMSGGNNVNAIGMSNSYGNYKSEVVCEAKNNSPRASMQLLNGTSTISSFVLSDGGANVTVPSGKTLSENGVEVVKINDILAYGTLVIKGTVPKATANVIAGGETVITPGWTVVSSYISNVPTGYTICGLCQIESTEYKWVIPTEYYMSHNSVPDFRMGLVNFNLQAKQITLKVTWFAIKTTGAKVSPDQSIDF